MIIFTLEMSTNRKLILYISMSLDGYIARKNHSLDFLASVERENEDYGYHEFVKNVDTIIIGRKTYDTLVNMGFEYPHQDKNVWIITRNTSLEHEVFTYYSGDLSTLIHELKAQPGSAIYCDGGAEIAHELMKFGLIDEFVISIVPVLLGDGIKLFSETRPEHPLHLISVNTYESGLVQLHYVR
jgi:dihydrofolate reductase